jgi:hypothetical protein
VQQVKDDDDSEDDWDEALSQIDAEAFDGKSSDEYDLMPLGELHEKFEGESFSLWMVMST